MEYKLLYSLLGIVVPFILCLFLKETLVSHRLLRCQLPKLESTVTLNVTLLVLTSSLPRSLKILFHRPTTVMYEERLSIFVILVLFQYVALIFFWFLKYFNVCTFPLQVPHVNRTDYQLIDISEDGFVCSYFPIFIYVYICFFLIPVVKGGLNLVGHC